MSKKAVTVFGSKKERLHYITHDSKQLILNILSLNSLGRKVTGDRLTRMHDHPQNLGNSTVLLEVQVCNKYTLEVTLTFIRVQ